MIELRYITTNGYDGNNIFVPGMKQLQYRVMIETSGAWAGNHKPENISITLQWSKWKPVPDVGWNWIPDDTETS